MEPEVKSFLFGLAIEDDKKLVIQFYSDSDLRSQVYFIGHLAFKPQELLAFVKSLERFRDKNPDFFEGTSDLNFPNNDS